MHELSRRDLLAAGAAFAVSPLALHADHDLVVLNGRVIDPETRLDAVRHLGIDGGRIVAVSTKELKGRRTIDARGLVVAPGFIDPLSHGQDLENDRVQALDGVTTKLQMEVGVPDVDAWYAKEKGARMLNFGAGTGHGWARSSVLGKGDTSEKIVTDAQLPALLHFIDRELRAGGLGCGFGLEYNPGTTRWELLESFRVAGRYHASCHVHTRYGTLLEEQSNLTAIEEVLAAALAGGAPLHVVHVPSMALGNTPHALALIERAQAHGFDVTCDFYPYTAFGTGIDSEVFSEGWQTRFGIDYKDVEWSKTHERMTPESFARFRKEGGMAIAHAIPEASVLAAAKSPATMIGTDGGLSKGVGHPRSAGTYARILGKYVREERALSLMTAIEKASLRPARRFERRCAEFRRKGRVQVGADADLAIFDPATVIDRATFDAPATPSVGFRHVLVGGAAVVRDGALVEDARPGRGLRAPRA